MLDDKAREFDTSRDVFFLQIGKFSVNLVYHRSAYFCRLNSAEMYILKIRFFFLIFRMHTVIFYGCRQFWSGCFGLSLHFFIDKKNNFWSFFQFTFDFNHSRSYLYRKWCEAQLRFFLFIWFKYFHIYIWFTKAGHRYATPSVNCWLSIVGDTETQLILKSCR